MGPDHHLHLEPGEELGHPVGAELVRYVAAVVRAPAPGTRTAGRVGPQQVAHQAPSGHPGGPRDPIDLVHVTQVWADSAVRAEYDAIDDRGHRHAVERLVERPPQPATLERAVPGPAIVVEPVPDVHGTALVVAAQQVNVFRVPGLQCKQQSDYLYKDYTTCLRVRN